MQEGGGPGEGGPRPGEAGSPGPGKEAGAQRARLAAPGGRSPCRAEQKGAELTAHWRPNRSAEPGVKGHGPEGRGVAWKRGPRWRDPGGGAGAGVGVRPGVLPWGGVEESSSGPALTFRAPAQPVRGPEAEEDGVSSAAVAPGSPALDSAVEGDRPQGPGGSLAAGGARRRSRLPGAPSPRHPGFPPPAGQARRRRPRGPGHRDTHAGTADTRQAR